MTPCKRCASRIARAALAAAFLTILLACTGTRESAPGGSGSSSTAGASQAGAAQPVPQAGAAGARSAPADGSSAAARATGEGRPVAAGAPAPEIPAAVATESRRFRTVAVGGRLEPRARIVHTVPASGFVRAIAVREGDRVAAGQTLLTVERDDPAGNYLPVVVQARTAGVVSEVLVQRGVEVRDGTPAVTVIGTGGYLLEAKISDKDAFRVEVGQTVTATSPRGTTVSGRLVARSQEPDYATGLFTLSFEFPNSGAAHIGEFFLMDLPVDAARGIFVPRQLVQRRYGRYFMWVLGPEDRLEARQVELGAAFGDDVLILAGLKAGERYLTRLTGREREGATPGRRS